MFRFFIIIPLFAFLVFTPLECITTNADSGIFMSFDGGEIWQQKVIISKKRAIADKDILTIALDPQDPNVIYLGTRGNGLYKSVDGGELWYSLIDENKVLSKRANVYSIAIDPQNTSHIYLGAYQDKYGRFFRSQDGGRSWEQVYIVSRPKYAIFAAAIDPFDTAVVYMGTAEGGFLKSVDYGKSWKLIEWFKDVISDIAIDPYDTRVVYISTFRRGIYKSADKGLTWQSFENKLNKFREAERVESLVMDRQNTNVLYSGSQYGLLKTGDGGVSWNKVEIVIPVEAVPILSVALNPKNSSHIYYGAGNVFYKTIDHGKNWILKTIPTTKKINYIAVNPENPDIIYLGIHK